MRDRFLKRESPRGLFGRSHGITESFGAIVGSGRGEVVREVSRRDGATACRLGLESLGHAAMDQHRPAWPQGLEERA